MPCWYLLEGQLFRGLVVWGCYDLASISTVFIYRYYKTFSGNYIGPDNLKRFKTYKGFVRKINEGIITYCNPASEILWEKKIYKGNKPFEKNGMRYIYASEYFNFFKEHIIQIL